MKQSYRWVIVAASFVSHVIIFGISWTTGIFYEVFKDEFGAESSVTALMTSLNTALLYGAGPVSGVLTNRFGHRVVSITGSFITMLGLVLSAFADSSEHLLITFGIISGFGLGLSYIPFISIIGPHFKDSRHSAVALGLAACGAGIGTMVFPPLLRFLINQYSWKGALFITGAISFNLCVTGSLLRPVEVTKEAMKRRPSISSGFSGLLRCHVFLNKHYVALCLNNVFLCFSMSIVYVHLAAYAESINCGVEDSALLYSVLGAANFCGRIAFGLLASRKRIGSIWCYLVALLCCSLATCLCPLATNYAGLVAYTAFFGFNIACIGPLMPTILIDFLNTASLASGYGYLLIFEAIGQLIGAPAAGWLYDATEFYSASFYLAGSSFFVSALIMIPSLKVQFCDKLNSKDIEVKKEDEEKEVDTDKVPTSSSATEASSKF